jgi:hypothetical protein
LNYLDFDDETTYPCFIKNEIITISDYLIKYLNSRDFKEGWQLAKLIVNEGELYYIINPIIEKLEFKLNDYVCTGWHIARVYDKTSYENNGIQTLDNYDSFIDRIIPILKKFEFTDNDIKILKEQAAFYLKRDAIRLGTVNFVVSASMLPHYYHFADNIGGEITRWSYKNKNEEYPYKKLWVEGFPAKIKFKYPFDKVLPIRKETIILELLRKYIISDIFNLKYTVESEGILMSSVPSEDILDIHEIQNISIN